MSSLTCCILVKTIDDAVKGENIGSGVLQLSDNTNKGIRVFKKYLLPSYYFDAGKMSTSYEQRLK